MSRPQLYDLHDIASSQGGYFRYSTLCEDEVLFVSEDDLWSVGLRGGTARRLTADKGQISCPAVSPDGQWVAYTSTEQGCPEVFVMPIDGGPVEQLTFSGAMRADVAGWSRDGSAVIICSNRREPFRRKVALYRVPLTGGEMEKMSIGDGHQLDYEPNGPGAVVARYSNDLARWKGYRGGTAGHLWIDVDANGNWERLLPEITAGIYRPMWIGERIYFITDEKGSANIHSCTPTGENLQRHTDHEGHYVRYASCDGADIVYTHAGDLYHLDTADDSVHRIDVQYPSSKPQLKPKFVDASDYLGDYSLHPEGHSLTIDARGKSFVFGNWEGAVRQIGRRHGVRYRLPRYLGDGDRILVVSDDGGEEHFEIHDTKNEHSSQILELGDIDIGRPLDVEISPSGDQAIFTNHRYQLLHLDVEGATCTILDESPALPIKGIDWAPDSRHVAYGLHETISTSVIKIVDVQDRRPTTITSGNFSDFEPCFDPEGRYLYFLSYRHFDPIVEELYFRVSMPNGVKPCVVTLRDEVDSPFFQSPRPLDESGSSNGDNGDGDSDGDRAWSPQNPIEIDVDHMQDRIQVFPVDEGRYTQIEATKNRVFWTLMAPPKDYGLNATRRAALQYYDLGRQKKETFAKKVSSFSINRSANTLAIKQDEKLRIVRATGKKPKDSTEKPGRDSGFVDLGRVTPCVNPRAEWCQMLREAWRLMRDQFWRDDMSGSDWDAIWERYKILLPRLSARSEFSDLVWAMQGELGTSHAYEIGGDYETPPQYQPGLLGADFRWDASWCLNQPKERFDGGLRIERIVRGDPWEQTRCSPLLRPGVALKKGDVILAIDGERVEPSTPVGKYLLNKANRNVELLVADGDGSHAPRSVTVKALSGETKLRYRDWVEDNRRTVHEATEGRIGYVHIPNMGLDGYAEFHRQYLREHDRDGLVVDVRFNGGGFVSQLILEVLARRPIGKRVSRHRSKNSTYPSHAMDGPLVALTSPEAGSDGDIFSHCFKAMQLGPLIGKRTWGGTIGISPSHKLADGSITTQPEHASWFEDIEFGLENHGAEPDIEVDFPPQVTPANGDPQLAKAISIISELLGEWNALKPSVAR